MRGRNQRVGATGCGRFALAAGLLTASMAVLTVSGMAQAQTAPQSKESCVTHAVEAEQKLGIPSGMLVAIALVESGQDGAPHPFAMSVQGRPYYARNVSDAARHLRDHRGQLRSNTYVGCMQLSVATYRGEFQPLEKIVEPRDNVFYAGQLLVRFHGEEGNWKTALTRYNGSSGRRAQAYVCKSGRACPNWTRRAPSCSPPPVVKTAIPSVSPRAPAAASATPSRSRPSTDEHLTAMLRDGSSESAGAALSDRVNPDA